MGTHRLRRFLAQLGWSLLTRFPQRAGARDPDEAAVRFRNDRMTRGAEINDRVRNHWRPRWLRLRSSTPRGSDRRDPNPRESYRSDVDRGA